MEGNIGNEGLRKKRRMKKGNIGRKFKRKPEAKVEFVGKRRRTRWIFLRKSGG